MYQFIETIAIKNKIIQNTWYHQQRVIKTLSHFNVDFYFDISKIHLPIDIDNTLHKCRITYNLFKIEKIEFEKYTSKKINNIAIIEHNEINYAFKYANRQIFLSLLKKANTDEIIIIKNNLITDSSYSNICLYDGTNWITPSTPLLKGTMRTILLHKNIIIEKPIYIKDLKNFTYLKFINALNDFENAQIFPIERIKNYF